MSYIDNNPIQAHGLKELLNVDGIEIGTPNTINFGPQDLH